MSAGQPWGFVVYRTVYDSAARWTAAKQKVLAQAIDAERDAIEENDGDPDTATLLFVEDEAVLKGKSAGEIRKIFNPAYDADAEGEPPAERTDGLCAHVCLVINAASQESILSESDTPYIIAVDATTETSDQATAVGDELQPVPWDGTMKVEVGDIFSSLYLRAVGEGALSMGEVHPDMGEIWEGI